MRNAGDARRARAESLLIAFATRRAVERGAELGYLSDQLRLRFGDQWPNAVSTIIEFSRNPVRLDGLVARLEGLGPQLRESSEGPSWAAFQREMPHVLKTVEGAQKATRKGTRTVHRTRRSVPSKAGAAGRADGK
jgi:hypothetical protein